MSGAVYLPDVDRDGQFVPWGLTRVRPDVYAREKELFQVLFPPLTADLLTYYRRTRARIGL
ncbi:hypothetical protein ACQP25_30155 [Microtetraspora malaysiensis]|uniref:hypothetical protein n=1 Tax=Microtetraspora malaysiensis TaxID=161358 RepID=UPI003D8C3566